MNTTTTFSGTFETTATNQPKKKMSYSGTVSRKKGKLSFAIETNIDGVVRKLNKNNITNPQSLAGDPEIQMFLQSFKNTASKRQTKKR